MKNYAKVGNRRGKPAFRTPSSFRYRRFVKVSKFRTLRRRRHSGAGANRGATKGVLTKYNLRAIILRLDKIRKHSRVSRHK